MKDEGKLLWLNEAQMRIYLNDKVPMPYSKEGIDQWPFEELIIKSSFIKKASLCCEKWKSKWEIRDHVNILQ